MLNILVTGSNGQVGSELQVLAQEYEHNLFFTDRESLDVTNRDAVENFILRNTINCIINSAAYTAVDKAESEETVANEVNHLAVKNLAELSQEHKIKLIHISTDYVFNGTNYKPYTEDDITNPQSVYGATKLAGEKSMQEINPKNSIIIRTSWVYSSFGANFVKTMLRLGSERDSLGVIFDQVGTPTYARDLARAILDILPSISNEQVAIYNYSNEGVCSWYDFAKAIMEFSQTECVVNAIETKEYPTPAKRPHYSLLNKAKIKREFDTIIPYWKDSLDECLKKMGERR